MNRAQVLACLYYGFFFAAIGVYIPYLPLYLQQTGLSGREIGLLTAVWPIMLLVASPLWGLIGDRFRIHRFLLPLATVGPIVPALLMLTVRGLPALAVLALVSAFFATPIVALIDSAVLDLVQGTRVTYGSIRVWGSVGFTGATWLMGYVLQAWGLPWLFYGYAVLLAAAGLTALGLPARRQALQLGFRSGLGQLLRQRALLLFLTGVFLIGATMQIYNTFYPLHLVALGGGSAWVGLAGALAAASELPVLYFSGPIFRRLGVRGTMLLGYGIFAARWAILALVASPIVALLTALSHGLSFGPHLAGSIAFVEKHTPPGLRATAQGLLTAAGYGVGAAAGALAGGVLFDGLGAGGTFGVAAVAALLAAGFVFAAGSGHEQKPE